SVHLVGLGDRRKAQDLPTLLREHMADEIVLVQPLTKAKPLGLYLQYVFNTLQIYLGSLYVNDFNLFGRTFHVTIQADHAARSDATDISRLYVRNSNGGMVPLSTLGQLRPTVGPEFVPHYNLYSSARINGVAAPGY